MWPFTKSKTGPAALEGLALCRLPHPLDLSRAERVLLFAPHPDDESLGCGGTLAQLARRCPVKAVLVTDGSGAGGLPAGSAAIRQTEFRAALETLGITDTLSLEEPDGEFRESRAFRGRVRSLLREFQPNWVLLPSPIDYHRDHVRIGTLLERLCREAASVESLLFYEIWAPVPATHIVDITEEVALKQRAIRCHELALGCADYEQTILALNRYRGLYLGRDRLAEAFWVVSNRSDRSGFQRIGSFWLELLKGMK